MTLALDMATLAQRAFFPGECGPQASDDSGLDFAALLNGRALLDTARAYEPAWPADGSKGQFALAARRFDEASLFGQAYLAMRLASNATPDIGGVPSLSGSRRRARSTVHRQQLH